MSIASVFSSMFAAPVAKPVPAHLDKLMEAIAEVAPLLSVAQCTVWADALLAPMRSSGIATARRIAAFLGQVSHESAGFTVLSENLNYSAERLCQVWPTHFNPFQAGICAHDQVSTGCRAYAERMGNGDISSGDGYRFRGAGLIQLTGRSNQTRFAVAAKIDPNTVGDYLRTPKGAAESACWFWTLADHKPSLNTQADLWDIASITRQINGGDNGAAERYALSAGALTALASAIA